MATAIKTGVSELFELCGEVWEAWMELVALATTRLLCPCRALRDCLHSVLADDASLPTSCCKTGRADWRRDVCLPAAARRVLER